MSTLDLRGLTPAPVTPFTRDGAVDYAAIQRLGSWLGSVDGVKGLVVLGHAGEGTFLTADEQAAVIAAFSESVDGTLPIIAGITLEGTAGRRRGGQARGRRRRRRPAWSTRRTAGCASATRRARRRTATARSTRKAACR